MVCHVLLEGQGWSPDHPDQLPLLPILVLDIVGVNIESMTGDRMHEISTNYCTNYFTKWSGIGQENEFLIATILGTGKPIDFSYFLYFN